jgi:hypothetical protein
VKAALTGWILAMTTAIATAAAAPIPLNDPAIFLSPYCWRVTPEGAAICPTSGGYLKFAVSGTTQLTLGVDTAINQGLEPLLMPSVKVIVSGPVRDGEAHYFQFPANGQANSEIILASGLDPKVTYQVLLQATGGDGRAMSGWSGTVFQTQLNHFTADPGAVLSRARLRPKRALFLGASYEQAYFGGALLPDVPMHALVDASLSWPFFVAYGFDCEYGQVGIGSQGWVRFGNGGYPPFPQSWDHFDQTHPKSFGSDLDYVFVHLAENDAAQDSAAVRRAVAAWIPAARAAFGPRTRIFLILSLPQIQSEPIRAGVADAHDAHTYLLDPGTEYRRVVFAGGQTWAAPGDGIHLDAIHQALFTAFVSRQAAAILAREGDLP